MFVPFSLPHVPSISHFGEHLGLHSPHPACLIYFPARGLAEQIRLTMAEAGIPWVEAPIRTVEEWNAVAPTLPYDQVPILEIDGIRLCQSRAIVLYIARRHHLYSTNPVEAAEIDQILEAVVDAGKDNPFFTILATNPPPERAAELTKNYRDGPVTKYFRVFESILARAGAAAAASRAHHSGLFHVFHAPPPATAYFVGGRITLADIIVWNFVDQVCTMPGMEDLLRSFPALDGFMHAIAERPRIAAYLHSPQRHPPLPSAELMEEIRKLHA